MTNADVAELYRNQGREVPAEFRVQSSALVKHKYSAAKKECDGIKFDSGGEAQAYQILKLWERAGIISKLELQPVFILEPKQIIDRKTIRAVKYVADFMFQRDGHTVVVDFKGVRLPGYIVKMKIFRARFPSLEFEEWNREKLRELSRC